MRKIIIGTRGSQLALRQTEMVAKLIVEKLSHEISEVQIEIIKTKGDKFLDLSLTSQPDKGLFTKEIEERLLAGEIDLAVHSLKDLPVQCTEGTVIGAYLPRAATADVVIGKKKLADLPYGAVVGTCSKRRTYQLQLHYPHLYFREIRGNVETRIRKVEEGLYDAIIMARAGIDRLGLTDSVVETLSEDIVVPAPGQAAIAVHVRDTDTTLKDLLLQIDHTPTRFEVEHERMLLGALGGGCAQPLGCVCHRGMYEHELRAFFSTEDATKHIYVHKTFTDDTAATTMAEIISELKTLTAK